MLFKQSITSATILLAAFSILSKVVFFGRESIIAGVFGTSREVDALVTAQVLPAFLTGLIATVLGMVIIPIILDMKEKNVEEQAWNLIRALVMVMILIFLVMFISLSLAGQNIIRLLAPGYAEDAVDLSTRLMLNIFPLACLDALGLFLVAVLQAEKHFLAGAVVPLANAVLTIPLVVLFGYYIGIDVVVWGWALGTFAQMAILLYVLRAKLFSGKWTFVGHGEALSYVFRFSFPVLIFIMFSNVSTFVDRAIASGFSEGSVAIINWSQKVYNLPLGFLVIPLVTALYPHLSESSAHQDLMEVRRRVNKSLLASWYLIAPISAIIVVLRVPIVRLLFERGAFIYANSVKMADVLMYYAIGLVAITTFTVLYRTCYSIRDMSTPVRVTLITSVLYVPLAVVLARFMGLAGIAMAFAVVMVVGSGLLLTKLDKKLRGLGIPGLMISFSKIIVVSVFIGILMFLLQKVMPDMLWFHLPPFVRPIVIGLIGGLVYLSVSLWLRIGVNTDWLRGRLFRLRQT